MSSGPVKNRRRVDITTSQKYDFCLYKEQNAKANQVDILMYFSRYKWGNTVSRYNVNGILKEQAKWLAVAKDSSGVLSAKSTKYTSMESAL